MGNKQVIKSKVQLVTLKALKKCRKKLECTRIVHQDRGCNSKLLGKIQPSQEIVTKWSSSLLQPTSSSSPRSLISQKINLINKILYTNKILSKIQISKLQKMNSFLKGIRILRGQRVLKIRLRQKFMIKVHKIRIKMKQISKILNKMSRFYNKIHQSFKDRSTFMLQVQ